MTLAHHASDAGRTPWGSALADTPDPLADVLRSHGVVMSFAKDEEIFGQGEEADLVYRVLRGAVRTTRFLPDGRRQVGGFHYAGDIFGLEAGAEHRFSAEALSDCQVEVLRRGALAAMVERDAGLERRLWALTVRALEHVQDHTLLLARKTACERVASFLLEMADRERSTRFDLPMGRQDMADYLGLTIETVSRMLTQLQASHVIQVVNCRTLAIKDRRALIDLSE